MAVGLSPYLPRMADSYILAHLLQAVYRWSYTITTHTGHIRRSADRKSTEKLIRILARTIHEYVNCVHGPEKNIQVLITAYRPHLWPVCARAVSCAYIHIHIHFSHGLPPVWSWSKACLPDTYLRGTPTRRRHSLPGRVQGGGGLGGPFAPNGGGNART